MLLDGALGQEQRLGDVVVGGAARDELGDLALPRGQLGAVAAASARRRLGQAEVEQGVAAAFGIVGGAESS